MEIYSPKKYRQKLTNKNTVKTETRETYSAFEESESTMGITMLELKEKARERFYNVMQYLFDVEEVCK